MKHWVTRLLVMLPVLLLLMVASGIPDTAPGMQHWTTLFGAGIPVWEGVLASTIVAVIVASVSTLLGAGVARFLQSAPRPVRSVLLALAWLPWAVSPVMAGIVFMVVYLRLGLEGTVGAVVLAHVVFSGAYAIVLMHGFWQRDIARYEETGRTLGASGFTLVRFVMWPVLRRPVALVFAQTFLISWFQYGVTLLVGSGRVQTLPVLVFGFVGESNAYLAAIASLLLVLPPMALLWAIGKEWTT